MALSRVFLSKRGLYDVHQLRPIARNKFVQVTEGISANLVAIELMNVSSAIIAQSGLLPAQRLNASQQSSSSGNQTHGDMRRVSLGVTARQKDRALSNLP